MIEGRIHQLSNLFSDGLSHLQVSNERQDDEVSPTLKKKVRAVDVPIVPVVLKPIASVAVQASTVPYNSKAS